MKKILAIVLLATSLFAFEPFENWSDKNERKFYYFMGLQLLDVASTEYVIRNGGYESNPILGRNPSLEKLLLTKVAVIPIVYGLLEMQPSEKIKGYTLDFINIGYIGVVGNNINVGIKLKF